LFRLLLVDDEPIAVDGLYELLQDEKELELELLRAYSTTEALACAEREKIDILLTDIRMPGISGLELADQFRQRWPRCRIIFLTGYRDFAYAQTAIRTGGVDYVLKTEGDEQIIGAIRKAIDSIRREWEDERFRKAVRDKLHQALPALLREYVRDLLRGETDRIETRVSKFVEIGLKLDPARPVLVGLGRVDRWPEPIFPSDKPLYLYSLQNIAEEYMSVKAVFHCIPFESDRFLWLVQPLGAEDEEDETWGRTYRFIQGTAESFQATCRELLKLIVSLAFDPVPRRWEEIGRAVEALHLKLSLRLGHGEEMLLAGKPEPSLREEGRQPTAEHDLRLHLKKLDLVETYIDNRQNRELRALIEEAGRLLEAAAAVSGNKAPYLALEVFQQLSACLMSYMNRRGLMAELADRIPPERISRLDKHVSIKEALRFLAETGEILCEFAGTKQEQRTVEIIGRIQQYVRDNLHRQLSLTVIAETFYLNPSYLSRLYKQRTGKGLLEFINETRIMRAMELLRQPNLKVNEIAIAVGLESAAYFTRLFKKVTGLTPQEYRELQIKT